MDNNRKYQQAIKEIPSTALDIYKMLPEGTRCEVIANELTMSPSPSREHQSILVKLTALLFQVLEQTGEGTLMTAPFDVYFEDLESVVQPDIFIVSYTNSEIIKKNGVFGVPDLIVEIISSNRAYDTQKKRLLYERAGVKEYFLIDPENKRTTSLQLTHAGTYEQVYEEIGLLRSQQFNLAITF